MEILHIPVPHKGYIKERVKGTAVTNWFEQSFCSKCSSCGCPFPGSVQGQVGWGFAQPVLVEGVPAHGQGLERDDV